MREDPSDDLAPPTGLLVIARAGDEPVGCGGIRLLAGGIAELTRVYVTAVERRHGVAARIVRHLERHAIEQGRNLIRLDTRTDLVEARALYARLGYREIAPFNSAPYAEHWFEKRL